MLLLVVVIQFGRTVCRTSPEERKNLWRSEVNGSFVSSNTCGFSFIVNQILECLYCRYQPSAKVYTLLADPAVTCWQGEFWSTHLLASASIAIYGAILAGINICVAAPG